jgi:hypothetical protein
MTYALVAFIKHCKFTIHLKLDEDFSEIYPHNWYALQWVWSRSRLRGRTFIGCYIIFVKLFVFQSWGWLQWVFDHSNSWCFIILKLSSMIHTYSQIDNPIYGKTFHFRKLSLNTKIWWDCSIFKTNVIIYDLNGLWST